MRDVQGTCFLCGLDFGSDGPALTWFDAIWHTEIHLCIVCRTTLLEILGKVQELLGREKLSQTVKAEEEQAHE